MTPHVEILERRITPRGSRWGPIPGDWYAQTFRNADVAASVRALHADSVIDRGDLKVIFETADDGGLTKNELAALRSLATHADYLGLTEPLEYFAERIANSLAATTQADTAAQPVQQWLYGTVRPKASGVYAQQDGTLFVDGISYTDIRQGAIGDCGLMAAFAVVALHDPDKIAERFIDNGDGTWFVSFYRGREVGYWVTVDAWLPTHPDGRLVYAKAHDGELWVALLEKAYAQHGSPLREYGGLEGTYTKRATRDIFGLPSIPSDTAVNPEGNVAQSFLRDGLVYFDSLTTARRPVVNQHVYVAVGYDSTTGVWTLFNPWGIGPRPLLTEYPGLIELTWAEMQEAFY